MTKKIFAMFLAVLMVVSLLPISVFAAEATCPGKGEHTLENCSYTKIKETAPGCGTMGFTTYQCDVCHEYFSESWVAPTGNHTWTELAKKAPTCSKPGYEAGKQCSVCNLQVPGATIPALSNQAQECEWVDVTPNINCEKGGTKKYECAYCGATYEKAIEPGVHTWDEEHPVLVTPATATAKGEAKVYCVICGDYKTVEVLNSHDHAWFYFNKVEPTCTATGMKAYRQCRVCNEIQTLNNYGQYATTTEAALVIPAAHEFDCPDTCKLLTQHNNKHEATCVDTVLHCHKCDTMIAVSEAHSFETWVTQKAADCVTSGYETSLCANCGIAIDTRILPALDHKSVTVSVPATCQTYAYTFTYCTRIGCTVEMPADPNYPAQMYPMVVDAYVPATELVVGEGFYLATEQTKAGTVLYFAGAMNGNYMATTNDVTKATKVFVEIVHPLMENAYRLYFFNAEGVKTYISVEGYINNSGFTAGSVKLTTTVPPTHFNWNATYGMLTTTVPCSETKSDLFFLGTYNNYETFSASSSYYLGKDGQFYAKLCKVGQGIAVKPIAYTFNKTAGFNANNHYALNETVIVPASCTTEGSKIVFCTCGYQTEVVIPAAHTWVDYAAGTVLKIEGKDVPAYKAPDCTDGYKYQYCSVEGCEATRKLTYTGYGHLWGALINETPDHVNTVVHDHYICLCGERLNVSTEIWADASKLWDTFEEADANHGILTILHANLIRVDCKTAQYDTYICDECQKPVKVKVPGTGAHSLPTDYVAPTCLNKGGFSTYKCTGCGIIIGDAALGEWNEIAALGHDFELIPSYEAAPCDAPIYNHAKMQCSRCSVTESDGTKLIAELPYTNYCYSGTFEYYMCHCGKEHIRNFVPAMGHELVERERYMTNAAGETVENPANFKSATCYATGYTKYDCKWCGYVHTEILPQTEHKNAAGEVITDKCTDTVTDRHCVECCKNAGGVDHATLGAGHDCAKADENGDDILDCLGHCIIGKVCHYVVNQKYPSTCLQDAYTLKICGDCDKHTVEPWAESEWNGHRPISNIERYIEVQKVDENGNLVFDEAGFPVYETIEIEPQPIILAGYEYRNYTWISVEVVNGEFVQNELSYVGKFLEYVEPTYTSEGYWKSYCEECKQIVTVSIPKKSGLEFNLSVSNAIEGVKDYTFGSLIEVVVSTDSNGEGIYGFDFDLDYYGDMVFVGYETMNDNFNFAVTAPQNADSNWIDITAYAVNDANGKRQNIAINGETALLKLYFRSMSYEAQVMEFVFDDDYAKAYKVNGMNVADFYCSYYNEVIFNRQYLDFNGDYTFSVADLFQGMTMLTGEHPAGKTYDVTLDINKDGELTLEEICLAYEFHVGNCSRWDLFVMGISAEEIELLGLNQITVCNNSACQREIASDAVYCPYCGNHQ